MNTSIGRIAWTMAVLACASLTLAGTATRAIEWLPGDEAVGVAAGDQQDPAIAQGDDLVLVVWADERSQPTGDEFFEHETASDIYGLRLNADGQILDTVPFVVTQARASQKKPQTAWNGTHWLVAFEANGELAAVRVAPTGEAIDAAPIDIFGVGPVGGTSWSLASDGDGWVVGFRSGNSYQMKALRIGADGMVEQPPTVLVPGGGSFRDDLELAHAGGVYLFTWSESFQTLAMRFDAQLQMLDPEPYLQHESKLEDLASNGSEFYILWSELSSGVFGSRVDTAGVKLDGAGVDIAGDNTPDFYPPKSVVWDGSHWKVVWETGGVLQVARVAPDGQVLDFGGVAVPGPSSSPLAATSTGALQLVRSDYVDSEYDVFASHVPASGPAEPEIVLSTGGPQQARSDLALGNDGYMVLFRSDVDASARIKAMPLAEDGAALLAEPLVLDSGPRLTGPGTPAVAWNGSHYLAVWGAAEGIVAQRLGQDGTLFDPVPFVVMPGFGAVDISALGEHFLVIGRQLGFGPQSILPVIARVRSDGAVLDPDGIVVGANYVRSVAVTTLGNRWLALWHRTFSHDDSIGENMGAFIDTAGTSAGDFQVFGLYSNTGGNSIFTMSAAAGPDTALIVQSAELSSGVETDLAGVLVRANGTVEPDFNMTPWEGNQYRAEVAWDGDQFVVVYNDQKNRFAEFTLSSLDARSDLFGMRIRPDGTIVDPQGFVFSLSKTGEAYPSIAAAGGVSLIAGSIVRNQAPFAAYRIGYERFGLGANQWPVAVASASTGGGDVPLDVQFDSLGSIDPDGQVVSYLWEFGDGNSSMSASPAHTFTVPGEYVSTLTVTDDGGARTTDTVRIEAEAPNVPPVAVAAADVTSGPPPLSVEFNADGSYDVDGTLGNIFWEFGDGGTYWGSPAFHTFTEAGIYEVTLTVWDDDGATGTDTLSIDVRAPCVGVCVEFGGTGVQPVARGGIPELQQGAAKDRSER